MLKLEYENGYFTRIYFPNKYEYFLNSETMSAMFQDLGNARLDANDQSAEWKSNIEPSSVSTAEDITSILGRPSARIDKRNRVTMAYNYHLVQEPEDRNPERIDASFVFFLDKDNERLVRSIIRIGKLKFKVDLPDETGEKLNR